LYLKTLAQRDKRKTLFDALTEATAQTLQCHFVESWYLPFGDKLRVDYDDIFDVDTGFHGL
jgi:hypothetical protein